MKAHKLFSGGIFLVALAFVECAAAVEFEVTLDPTIAAQPVSGRLYVFLTTGPGDPRQPMNWFNPEPFFRIDVKDFQRGPAQMVGDSAAGFPDKLSRLASG